MAIHATNDARMIEASVIIPTYNRTERLRACLEALCHQTEPFENFQVIVVVDGSTDGTREMLATFQAPYALHVVEQLNNGQCAALNHGAETASGRICIFIDDDIVAGPTLVAEHLGLHRERDNVVGIGQITLTLPADADWFARYFAKEWNEHYAELNQAKRQPGWQDCYGGNMSVARETFLQVGGNTIDLPRAYDFDLAYRLEHQGCSFAYLPIALGNQDERKGFNALTHDIEQSGAACVELYHRYPPMLPVLLGTFPEQRPIHALMWRILSRFNISAQTVDRFRKLFGRNKESYTWYRFINRYCFWKGVRRALSNADTWHRLTYGTPILMYHALANSNERASRYIIPASRFRLQMLWLRWMGYRVLDLAEFIRYRREYRLPPAHSIVITFDDGYADNFTVAYPILRRFGFPATIFVVNDGIDRANTWDKQVELSGRKMLSAYNLREMSASGMSIGAHTCTHRDLTTLSREQAREEMASSRDELEQKLGVPVQLFSYPYGKHSEALMSLAEQAGYSASCGINVGSNSIVTPLQSLRRVEIWGTDSLIQFAHAVRYGTR